FFPLAGTPHCTTESCMFRDALMATPVFHQTRAIVIGISQDPPARSSRFVQEHKLTYRVLYDEGRRVMNRWGVSKAMLGLADSRCTFVVDPSGVVRGMAEGVFDSAGHIKYAERWLTRIEHE
ncbi:alkyl hydroperoxide reductase/ thiol specific antioxidant/ Mal allergen, partial [Ceraceosorus guamensis]